MGLNWTAQGVGAAGGLNLSSHFQAIFGAAERCPIGYEALIRATRGDRLPVRATRGEGFALDPPQLLRSVPEGAERASLDRQCRRVQVEKFIHLGDAHSR